MFFATAHSRGLRRKALCEERFFHGLCHSAFARVATALAVYIVKKDKALPQRIRAGCDCKFTTFYIIIFCFATAHSRGLRQQLKIQVEPQTVFATAHSRGLRRERLKKGVLSLGLCHSAFARVATLAYHYILSLPIFATAHSRGLRQELNF